jgi:histidinol-phosphate phosphatase family protein
VSYSVVIPTVGRTSLRDLLDALVSGDGPRPDAIVVVDDRPAGADLDVEAHDRIQVVRTGGRGPAAARNAGARCVASEWIVFLDDDVIPAPGWRQALAGDLAAARDAQASQGRVRGFEGALWISADIAYRRDAFARAGGFDVRFPRAYREDSDLALRIVEGGGRIAQGMRWSHHPPTEVHGWASVTRQRGNADDALMWFLHGRGWQRRAGAPRGMRASHLASTALFAAGVVALVTRQRPAAAVALATWVVLTGDLARRRRHVTSSVALPFAATYWWCHGLLRAWRLTRPPRAVLFDRDGTLVEDVPYNGDPSLVTPRPGARAALDRLRAAGVRVAMVTNQSGVARGLISADQVTAVNRKVEETLGPFAATLVCVHGPDDACGCRKPRPGLLLEAARRLGVHPNECVVIGDIESDVVAAANAGARGVLVPNEVTRPEEIRRAKEVASNLEQAVTRLLGRGT